MKLVTFLHDNKEAVGVLTEDGAAVRPLPFADMNALIQASREALLAAVKGAAATLPLSAVTLLAPIPRPRQDVICLGINYKAHTEEAARYSSEAFTKERPIPINFSKRVTEAVAPEGDIESHPGLVERHRAHRVRGGRGAAGLRGRAGSHHRQDGEKRDGRRRGGLYLRLYCPQ